MQRHSFRPWPQVFYIVGYISTRDVGTNSMRTRNGEAINPDAVELVYLGRRVGFGDLVFIELEIIGEPIAHERLIGKHSA